jgi:DNA-binding SARP family transcriptional activator
LAASFVAQLQLQKAIQRVNELASAHPKSAPLQYLLGQLLASNGDLDSARTAFQAAKVADLKFIQADLALAQLDARRKRTDAARQRLEAVTQADPRSVPAHLQLAGLEEAAGNRGAATTRYRAVLDQEDRTSQP